MLYLESCNLISADLDFLHRIRQFMKNKGEGKLRRNAAQCIHHPFQSPGADQSQRLGPLGIAHRQ